MDVDVGGRYEPAVNQDAELCVTGSNQQNTDVTETLETEPTAIDWNDVLENVQVRLVRPHAGCAIAVWSLLGWWRGVAVTRFIRSTKLLYAGPG